MIDNDAKRGILGIILLVLFLAAVFAYVGEKRAREEKNKETSLEITPGFFRNQLSQEAILKRRI